MLARFLFAAVAALAFASPALAQTKVDYTRTEDVIYGRKFGLAMTMDIFAPKDREKANGKGVIFCVSGGWVSAKVMVNPAFVQPFLDRGYTVFAVVHGSQPKFTIPEILDDMHRAVRFIRQNAKDYGIDPERLGIYGGSAGGHLSLMQGTRGKAADGKSKDKIDHASSRVQAVACFFPPTDFLNYGEPGKVALGGGTLKGFKAPFDFQVLENGAFVRITDEEKRREIGRAISPIYHISNETPPTLIVHGDADTLVPIQQAQIFIDRLKEVGVPGELVVRKDAGHGWSTLSKDLALFADWFDRHLRKMEKKPS
jgi:acetyl esterase/lipase